MTTEERAEKFAKTWCADWQNASIDLTVQIREAVEEAHNSHNCTGCFRKARAESYEDAAKIAGSHSCGEEKLCNDPAHDDRYCGTCSAMRDEADILEQAIRARAKEVGK